jgi:hypothetical protein
MTKKLHILLRWKLRWESNSCLSPVVWCYNRLMMRLYRSNIVLSTRNYFLLLIFLLFLSPAFFQIIFMWQITTQFNHGKNIFGLFSEKKIMIFYLKKNSCFFPKKVFFIFFCENVFRFFSKNVPDYLWE